MTEIVIVLGSARMTGNSTTLANSVGKTAEEMGATVKTYKLNKMSYRGCQGCERCKKSDDARCHLEDDLTEVLDSVEKADGLVLASPVYFGDVSSQLKAFIDRTYSFMKPQFTERDDPSKLEAGKKMLVILTQGDKESVHDDIFKRYRDFYVEYGFSPIKELRIGSVDKIGDVKKKKGAIESAKKAASLFF